MERKVGDLVVDQFGQVCVLLELDAGFAEPYDRGLSIRPRFGVPVKLKEFRPVIGIEQLLQLGEKQGLDFESLPELELTELQKLQRDNKLLAQRLAALESKQ